MRHPFLVGCTLAIAAFTGLASAAPVLRINERSVAEGDSGTRSMVFTLSLSEPAAGDVRFDVRTQTWGPTPGVDYDEINAPGLVIPAGQTSRTVTVTIHGDTAVEGNETFKVLVENVQGATYNQQYSLGHIVNDDGPVARVYDAVVQEGTGQAQFFVRLSEPADEPYTISLRFRGGTATEWDDYTPQFGNTTREFAPGVTELAFTVPIVKDDRVEPTETIEVGLDYIYDFDASIYDPNAILTILDDDQAIVSLPDVPMPEGDAGLAPFKLTARLSQAALEPVDVDVRLPYVLDGQSALCEERITLPTGATAKAVACGAVQGDTVVEPNEVFHATVVDVSPNAALGDGEADVTVLNDDGPTLSIGDVAVAEGDAGTRTATFTVALSEPAPGPVTFDLGTGDAGASAGSDYDAVTLLDQSIPAGQLTKTFAVTVHGDADAELNESFLVLLANASVSLYDGQATGTILNDDGPTLSIGDVQVVEGASGLKQVVFVVTLSELVPTDVTYSITTSNGTAVAGSDFVARSLVGEKIERNRTHRSFAVNVKGDTAVEANETFFATITAASGATRFDSQAVATILNDDGPTLSIADASVTEGDAGTKTLSFLVTLSQPASAPVYFQLATANGTASSASDYVARTASLNLPAGMTSKTFGVSVRGDVAVEASETFVVKVSNVSGPATLLDGQGTGTIANDD